MQYCAHALAQPASICAPEVMRVHLTVQHSQIQVLQKGVVAATVKVLCKACSGVDHGLVSPLGGVQLDIHVLPNSVCSDVPHSGCNSCTMHLRSSCQTHRVVRHYAHITLQGALLCCNTCVGF